MSIINRVRALELPPHDFVVIGSGVLDALQLREAGDVDLVMSSDLFTRLQRDERWLLGEKHGRPILTHGDTEAFLSWGSNGAPNFMELYETGMTIDGIRFTNPQFVINWKRRGLDKDIRDIALLEGYLKRHNNE